MPNRQRGEREHAVREEPREQPRERGAPVVADDLSERYAQLEVSGGQWSKGKCLPGFCPTGPWLVTPDEVDHRDLRLRSWVNGEPRQDSTTADLVFGPQELVDFIAETCTLEPGDLILTGTPAGVGQSMDPPRFLGAGDVVRCEVEGLGVIEHRIEAA